MVHPSLAVIVLKIIGMRYANADLKNHPCYADFTVHYCFHVTITVTNDVITTAVIVNVKGGLIAILLTNRKKDLPLKMHSTVIGYEE